MSAERLAIDGGTPVRTEPFTKRKPFGARELELLKEALESQTLFAPESDMVRRFEAAVSELYGVKYAIGTTSGTAALHLAVGALGLNPGDEVITAPITDMGTVIPILFQNGVPVFADTAPGSPRHGSGGRAPEDYAADPGHHRSASHGQPRGNRTVPGNRPGARSRLDRRLLPSLRDQAARAVRRHLRSHRLFQYAAVQARYDGRRGFCITNDPVLADKMRLFSDKGWLRKQVSDARVYTTLGLNYRMNGLQAAVGLAQIEKVRAVVERKK